MSYIRSKEIPPGSGNWYNYEVMGVRTGKKVRQKVIRYIGRSGSGHSTPSSSRVPISLASTFEEPATPLENKARIHKMKTPSKQIASAMGMYYGGMSAVRGIRTFETEDDD